VSQSDKQDPIEKELTMAQKYAAWVMRNRLLVVMIVVITTLLAATQIPNLDIRNDPDTLLPPSNRYVATNAYGEQKFGMGNLMVLGFILKEPGDIYQPWFINLVKDVHERMVALPNSRGENFLDLAAQKIKYMGASDGSLVFKRLIPTDGISSDPQVAKKQLAFLKEGLETNPVMAPMLLYMEDAEGNRCEMPRATAVSSVRRAVPPVAPSSSATTTMALRKSTFPGFAKSSRSRTRCAKNTATRSRSALRASPISLPTCSTTWSTSGGCSSFPSLSCLPSCGGRTRAGAALYSRCLACSRPSSSPWV